MPRQFATLQQYRDWSGDQAAVLSTADLAAASYLVAQASTGAVYAADSVTGMPTDTAVLTAFRDATCAVLQDRHGGTAGEASEAAAALRAAGLKSASIGTTRYEVSDVTAGAAGSNTDLPWLAYAILEDAGLIAGQGLVVVYG